MRERSLYTWLQINVLEYANCIWINVFKFVVFPYYGEYCFLKKKIVLSPRQEAKQINIKRKKSQTTNTDTFPNAYNMVLLICQNIYEPIHTKRVWSSPIYNFLFTHAQFFNLVRRITFCLKLSQGQCYIHWTLVTMIAFVPKDVAIIMNLLL